MGRCELLQHPKLRPLSEKSAVGHLETPGYRHSDSEPALGLHNLGLFLFMGTTKLITLHFILYQLSERTAELEKTRSDLLVLRSEVMTKLPLIEMQVTSLSTNVEDLHDGLSGTNTTVSTLRGEFDELKTNFDVDTTSLRTDLSATQGHVMTLTLDQERNQRDLVLVNSDLTKVSGRTTEIESDVRNIKTNVEDLHDSLSGIYTTFSTFRDEFDQLKKDFGDGTSSLRADLTTTQGHVVTMRSDLSVTQDHVVTLDAKLDGASRELQQVKSDLEKLDTRVKTIEEAGSPGAPELGPVYSKIEEVENTLLAADEIIRGDLTKATVTLGENPEQLTSQKTTLYEHTLLVKDHGKRLGDAETNIISLGEANDIAVNEITILKTHAGKADQNLERTQRRVELLEVEVESIKNKP
jgi:chromosome segregation ATPase